MRVIPLVLLTALTLIATAQPSEASAAATKTVQRRLNALGSTSGPSTGTSARGPAPASSASRPRTTSRRAAPDRRDEREARCRQPGAL